MGQGPNTPNQTPPAETVTPQTPSVRGAAATTENISFIVDGSDEGKFVPGVDDLARHVKITLGAYLHQETKSTNNTYKVDRGLNATYKLSDENGFPTEIAASTNSEKFTSDLSAWMTNYLDKNSNSGISIEDYLSKGRPTEPGRESGHTLLPKVDGMLAAGGPVINGAVANDGTTPVQRQVSAVLRTNRFNPTAGNSPFLERDEQLSAVDGKKIGRWRDTLGTYENPNATSRFDFSLNDLKSMSDSLAHIAAGGNPEKDPTTATGIYPGGGVQLAVKRLDRAAFKFSNTFTGRSNGGTQSPDLLDNMGEDSMPSWGQVNTSKNPFGGLAPFGMIALAAALTSTMLISAEVIFTLLGTISNATGRNRHPSSVLTLGSSSPRTNNNVLSSLIGPEALGLIRTEHDYFTAAKLGASIFFGFTGEDLKSASGQALKNIVQSPGYYVTLVRAIIRSFTVINDAIARVDLSNPVTGATMMLGIIDVMKSSKVVSFMNICAMLGDIAINEELSGTSSLFSFKTKSATIDNIPDDAVGLPPGFIQDPAVAVFKNRTKTGTNTMSTAWRSSSSPAMYILPKAVLDAAVEVGADTAPLIKGTIASPESHKFIIQSKGQNRFTHEQVVAFENALEGEYVPFYFHDLRTNEIISFHAFLNSLNENYSADYESTDGYGRIDAIKTYKSTTRTIDFSFIVASTSASDFDAMWWKVNKLITLLYPQWGEGRVVKQSDGTTFTQPFSQIPTASPLIRLRIGDVIKSNGSKFNLMRLFGLGDSDRFTMKTSSGKFTEESGFTEIGEVEAAIDLDIAKYQNLQRLYATSKERRRDPAQTGLIIDGFVPGDIVVVHSSRDKFVEADGLFEFGDGPQFGGKGVIGGQLGSKDNSLEALKKNNATKSIKLFADSYATVVRRVALDEAISDGAISETVYVVHLDTAIHGVQDIYVSFNDLKFIGFSTDVLVKANADITATAASETTKFFLNENNPVMRAFESASGRGLAGVIRTMNFNWFEPTWETEQGKRAPKWCEINVTFDPMHDIAPGIDKDGFNRAPVYAVGDISGRVAGDIHGEKYDDIRATYKESMERLTKHMSKAKSGS